MDFSKNLKKIRQKNNLSQQQLGEKLNVAQSTIGMWESGKRTPKLADINKLAAALRVTTARLIGQKSVEITDKNIVINGQKIDISELADSDIEGIVEFINFVKTKKKPLCSPARPSLPPINSKAKKVLVIDDEQEFCEMLYTFLAPHNYKIFLAFNGQMGLEYFEEIKPDIVLLDLKLPDIDGVEVLKIIRKVNNTPVLVITAHPQDVADIHLSGSTIEGYIEKPVSLTLVLNTLKRIIGE